ncbi:hypothetical protein HPB51_022688 [Rhipicephalus microplus]|uniref:Uncharacterized protein n=1 Tax=Rhipicephalus microplus TaxID=6941 RepID=A0A9J6E4V8_RHIMP|nr:hypothetical protein HPB51_022688 [Rhipicephalus microplus]
MKNWKNTLADIALASSASDPSSADTDHQVAAVDQRAFCNALIARYDRDDLYSRNRWRARTCDLWGLGVLAAVGALVLTGVFWMLNGDNATLPPREYRDVTDEFNATSNDTANVSQPRGRRLESESWILDDRESVVDETKSSDASKDTSFCDTAECQRTVAFLEQQLDPTFSPCDSLYDHVCTRWRERHAKSTRRRGSYSVDDAILDGYRRKLARRLDVDDKRRPFRKMRSFFLQCTRNQLTSRYELDEIRGLLELGNSPSVVALATSIVRLARIGFSPFFDVSVTGYPETFRVKLFRPASASGFLERPATGGWVASGEPSSIRPTPKVTEIVKRFKLASASGFSYGQNGGLYVSEEASSKGSVPRVRSTRVKLSKQASTSGFSNGLGGTWFASGEISNERPMAKVRQTIDVNLGNTSDAERTLFIVLLGRIICSEIVRSVPEADKKCSLEPGSAIYPDWNYGWYKSVGVELLTMAVDRELGSLIVAESTTVVPDGNDDGSISVIDSASHQRWKADKDLRDACLNLMDMHDPYLLSYWSAITTEASQLEQLAKESIRQVAKADALALLHDLSVSYGLPAAFDDNFTALSVHVGDLYGDESESSRLLRFLANSTWKLWLGITSRGNALGTTAVISETTPSLITVPEPVFNLTTMKDPWLRLLAAARYTPRILEVAVHRHNLAKKLMSSPFGQCASNYFTPSNEYDDSVGATRRLEAYLGAFELAAFHTGLDIYRSGVGKRVDSVPGTDLDGDSLFLFYYVFNQCEAASSKRSTLNLNVPRHGAVFEATARTRRNYFPRISNLLAKIILPGCEASGVQFTGCGAVATKYDNAADNMTANSPQ